MISNGRMMRIEDKIKLLRKNRSIIRRASGFIEYLLYWSPQSPLKKRKIPKHIRRRKRTHKETLQELIDRLDNKKPLRKRKKGNSFLESVDWKLLRERVFHYYGKVCMKCGTKKCLNIDHIKPRSKYPELIMEFNNLQVLCWPCNRKKNFRDETDYRERTKP